MRVGYGFCNAKVKHIFGLDLPLFRENTISRKMAVADKEYYERMNKELNQVKTWFIESLNQMEHVRAFQSDSNFVAVRIENTDMQKLREYLKERGILIRLFTDKEELVARIAVADRNIMEETIRVIKEYVGDM